MHRRHWAYKSDKTEQIKRSKQKQNQKQTKAKQDKTKLKFHTTQKTL